MARLTFSLSSPDRPGIYRRSGSRQQARSAASLLLLGASLARHAAVHTGARFCSWFGIDALPGFCPAGPCFAASKERAYLHCAHLRSRLDVFMMKFPRASPHRAAPAPQAAPARLPPVLKAPSVLLKIILTLITLGDRLQSVAAHTLAPPPLQPPAVPLPAHLRRTVWWHAPFLSGSGMGLEALQLVLGLERHTEFAGRCGLHGNLLLPEIPRAPLTL